MNMKLFQDKNDLKKYLSSALPSLDRESFELETLQSWGDLKAFILEKLPQNQTYLHIPQSKFRDYDFTRDDVKKAIKNYVLY